MSHIFQGSDLTSQLRELLDTARSGFAQIRDTDGTGLVLTTQGSFDLLRALRDHLKRFVALEAALARAPAKRQATDFGDLAWLTAFDADDQETFRRELIDALMMSIAQESIEPAERCLADWRRSARALSDPKSRRVHLAAGGSDSEFEEVERPE